MGLDESAETMRTVARRLFWEAKQADLRAAVKDDATSVELESVFLATPEREGIIASNHGRGQGAGRPKVERAAPRPLSVDLFERTCERLRILAKDRKAWARAIEQLRARARADNNLCGASRLVLVGTLDTIYPFNLEDAKDWVELIQSPRSDFLIKENLHMVVNQMAEKSFILGLALGMAKGGVMDGIVAAKLQRMGKHLIASSRRMRS